MPKWAMLWPWVRKKVSLWPADSWPADGSVLVLNYCQPCNAIEQLSRTATRLAGIAVNAGQRLIIMGLVGQWVHWMVITCHVWQLLCPKWWSLRMSILFAMVWPKLYSTICPHDVMCNDWPGWPPWSQEPYWVILFYYIIIIIMRLSTVKQGLKLTLIPWSDFLLLLSKSRSKSDHHRSYFLSLRADIWLDWVAKLCS